MNKQVIDAKPTLIKESDIVCLSGPITGIARFNFPLFRDAEQTLKDHFNCTILTPIRHAQAECLPYDYYMRLSRVDVELCTVFVSLQDWEKSKGAKIEWDWAHELNKRCLFMPDIVRELEKIGGKS